MARLSGSYSQLGTESARPREDARALVVGGGIGGLATAIALARLGLPSLVLERQAEFSEAGAGIQLGPNGMRVLAELGVDRALAPMAARPDHLDIREGASGSRLATVPFGTTIATRHGAPYVSAHRADLQRALLEVARATPGIEIATGFEVADIAQSEHDVTVIATDGRREPGHVAVAADGLWSRVRRRVFGAAAPGFSFRSAARTLIPVEALPALRGTAGIFGADHVGIWLAPRTHVVHYPVRAGTLIAVVVVTEDDWQDAEWSAPDDAERIARRTASLAASLRAFLALAPEWRKWSLFDVPPLAAWTCGRVALLGDAAHPVMPFLAQGGVLALEDAITIAQCLARGWSDPPAALVDYERRRRARAIAVQDGSRDNGRIYHMGGMMALARNTVLRATPPHRLLARYDWLYGWKPDPLPTTAVAASA